MKKIIKKFKSLIKKLFLSLSPKSREKLIYFNNFIHIKKYKKNLKQLKQMYKCSIYKDIEWGEYNEFSRIWYNNYKKVINFDGGIEEGEAFYKDIINIEKKILINKNYPILICLVKNDIERIKKLINHYKKLGIINFVFIDNNSCDGTYEYLFENQVFLFKIKKEYSTMRRQAWINRVISYFGFDKWYIIVDSDEMLIYNDIEKNNINALIKYFEKEKIKRIKCLMIDMYPKSLLLSKKLNSDNFMKDYCFFDKEGYCLDNNIFFKNIIGGMRKRIFNVNAYLVKYPIIFFDKKTIQFNSHYSYPFYLNFKQDINIGLLHYKFLPTDIEKIRDIVKKQNFAGGSKEYKKYLKIYDMNEKINLITSNSEKFNNADDIYKIKLIKRINWGVDNKNDK